MINKALFVIFLLNFILFPTHPFIYFGLGPNLAVIWNVLSANSYLGTQRSVPEGSGDHMR